MSTVAKLWLIFLVLAVLPAIFYLWQPEDTFARNVQQYSDTITDSAPNAAANHTFKFRIDTAVAPGGRLEFTPPVGFELLSSPGFNARNVELWVNGVARPVAEVGGPGVDQVEITTGSPGFIRYTLAPDFNIEANSQIEFRIGNHTSGSLGVTYEYSSTTMSTSTIPGDIRPVKNSATLGKHDFKFEVWDGGLAANAEFLIFMVSRVQMPGVDSTEKVPPYRFNPAPTSTVGGTTLSVEISLETDEFSICKLSTTPGTSFGAMSTTFQNTGLIYHSQIVPIVHNSQNTFYIRCVDDEGNFNIDDFVISFYVNAQPTGVSNTTGSTSGNGTGSGNNGTGSGSGSGGTTGGSSGQQPASGTTAGTGGSGGGSGGGKGRGSGGGGGGGGGKSGDGNEGFQDDALYRSGDARVIISGYAYPNSPITVLVDGKLVQTTRANGFGAYTSTIEAIAKGVYTFGVYAESPEKTKSSTFSTSFTVTGARTSELTNINIAPSIKVTPNPVDPGQLLTVSGYSLPNATILLQNGKAKTKLNSEFNATADGSGKWSTTIPTTGFSKGSYQVRAKATQSSGVATNFSDFVIYGVGEQAAGPLNADLNRDGKVNLVDFSILLFWWNTDGGDSNPPADINGDGKVSLTDFSIQLFNWTG